MTKSILVSLIFCLSACATSPIPASNARPVPQERVFLTFKQAKEQTSKIVVIRDSGMLGVANLLHLFLDGKALASFESGEMLEVDLPSGEHVFGVKPTDPFGLASTFSIDQELKPGRIYRYRLIHTPNGSRMHRVSDTD